LSLPLKWHNVFGMRLINLIAFAVGAIVVTVLVATFDRASIVSSISAVGWGLAAICFYRVLPLVCEALGWSCLLPIGQRPPFSSLLMYRWISKAINTLLPAMQIGGDLVRASLLIQSGARVEAAGSSVIVDVTIWLAAQLVFILIGVAIFAAFGLGGGMMGPIAVSVVIGTGLILAFYFAQRHGLLRICAKLAHRLAGAASADRVATALQSIDLSVATLYRSKSRVAATGFWHLSGWLLRTGDSWLVMYFMGMTIGLPEAIILESVSIAVRSAAFMVPAGVGAQEATIVAVGMQLGLSPEVSIALALVKRLQELIVFLPGLAAWYCFERGHWTAGRQRLTRWGFQAGGSAAEQSETSKSVASELEG
jgi:putative membrane protein